MRPLDPLSAFLLGAVGVLKRFPQGYGRSVPIQHGERPQPGKVLYAADQLRETARPAGEAPEPRTKLQARLGRRPWLRGGRSQAQSLHSDPLSCRAPSPRRLHLLVAQPGPTPYLELFLPGGLGSEDTVRLHWLGPSEVPLDMRTHTCALRASQHPRPGC